MTKLQKLQDRHSELVALYSELAALHANATDTYERAVYFAELNDLFDEACGVFADFEMAAK